MTKTCVKCGSPEFSPRGDCVPCKRIYDAEYRVKSREKVSAAKKKCYAAKKDEYVAKARQHYEQNKESASEWSKKYRAENRAVVLARKKEYRDNNREKIAAAEKEYYEKNKEYVSERQRNYALANPEVQANSHARRRLRVGDDRLSVGIFTKLFVDQLGFCNGCGTDISGNRKSVHIDHIMPLALGGRNLDSNVQLLCARCNLTKSAKHPIDWLAQKPAIGSSISYVSLSKSCLA